MGFVLGAIVGASAMWVYGDRLRAYLDDKTRNDGRIKAADTLQSAAEGLRAESGASAEPNPRAALVGRKLRHLNDLGPLHALEHQTGAGQDQAGEIWATRGVPATTRETEPRSEC